MCVRDAARVARMNFDKFTEFEETNDVINEKYYLACFSNCINHFDQILVVKAILFL